VTDIGLFWDSPNWRADVAIAKGDLAADDGLRTAVILSLFTNAPARADDVLPAGTDRGGWWGDALARQPGEITGSRLWLLSREKQLSSVLNRARAYAAEALKWLVDAKIAAVVRVNATNPRDGVLALSVEIDRPAGPGREVYDFLWEATS